MRVLADSHAVLWYTQGSDRLSPRAAGALTEAEAADDATTSIPRKVLGDPWDRFIVATAQTLGLPLVTRDSAIRDSGLLPTIW